MQPARSWESVHAPMYHGTISDRKMIWQALGASMSKKGYRRMPLSAMVIFLCTCSQPVAPERKPWDLHKMVASVQESVVTVAAVGAKGDILRIGSGFFIDRNGTLVTNDHVLDDAFAAKVKTVDGEIFTISTVTASNPLVDLIKVRVQIPPEQSVPAVLSDDDPGIADRVVVIGSPMGLAHTISEGIVAAVRNHPTLGKVYQLTAPISPGSSGGPVLNLRGQVIGVVSFQTVQGQNINFAVAIHALRTLSIEAREPSIAEWTLEKGARNPRLAAALCHQGARLSIKGKYEAALDYFRQATEANPDDPHAWSGLGSCYIGLNQPDHAIEALNRSIAVAPEDAAGHLMLAMYYKELGQFGRQIESLSQILRIDPENMGAHMDMADAYGRLGQTAKQIETYRQILKLKPDHVPTLQRMGRALGRVGRYKEALEALHRAGTLEPDNAEIYFEMGVIYNARNLPKEELQAYIRAIRVDPQMVPAHFSIALLFLKNGNRNMALQEYAILKSLDREVARKLFEMIYPESIDKTPAAEPDE
jgi:tetratricopeptide (TPR) repeat protein